MANKSSQESGVFDLPPTELQCRDITWRSFGFIIISTETGEIVHATERAEATLGYTIKGSLIGKNIDVLIPNHLRIRYVKLRQQFLTDASKVSKTQFVQAQKADNTPIDLFIALSSEYVNRKLYVAVMLEEVAR